MKQKETRENFEDILQIYGRAARRNLAFAHLGRT